MIKEYCDICGNKAKTKKYYLPKRKDNGNVVKIKKYICQECESILDVFANNFKSLAKDKIYIIAHQDIEFLLKTIDL